MDQKTNQLLEEIDLARCRAQWSTLLDLSKKYKKFKPEDSVLDITLCTEVELIHIIKSSNDIEKRGWDIIHQHDTPSKITLLPIIESTKVQHLLKRLSFLNMEQNELTDTDNWQTQFSKIILARIYFESGQYENTLNALQNLALRVEDVQTGYGLVLLIQARAMKGISLEKQNEFETALEAYEAAWHAVEQQPQERGVMLSFWIEECLYRGVLLRLRLNHSVKDTMTMMRAYLQLVSSHWSPHWRMFRRWVIFKYYAEYLVKAYQNNTYVANEASNIPLEMAAFEELATLMTLFRHLFTIILPYLTHSAQNEYAMSLAHIMMASHDIIGWGETNHIRRVLQYLYQVKNATFNNPTVSRFMFFTLMRLGGLEEAKYALRSYLDLIGVPDFDRDIILEDTTSIEDAREASNNHDAEERNSTTDIAPLFSTRAKAQSIVQRLAECADESIESVTQVLLAGVYLYGHEEQHGELAAYLSDLGLDLLILLEQTGSLIVNMFRARGTSYSLLASRCVDPQDRAAHHQTAIASLQKAVDLDNTCWKSFYCLGLQQALMRDAHTAIKSVCKSIELNPHHISSWHLLALLYSCKRTDNINKAIQTLEAGLSIYNSQALHSINGIPVFSWTQGEINASDLFETAEAYLSMRMSQLSLKEALEGPESVLDQYADLFTTYSQITQQLGLLGAPVTSSPAAIDDTVSESTNGGKSRRKSSISLIRRTSFSSIANSITGGGSSSGSIHSTNTQGRPRASSVEESKDSKRPPSSMIRRAESDTDDISDDSQISRRSSFSRKQKTRSPNPIKPRSNSTSVQQDAVELKKRSLQLIDLGLARRIGTAAANSPQHAVGQGSTRSLLTPMTEGSNGAVSLASLLTPSYSMGSLRSNSVGSRSSSTLLNGRVVTRDGLMVSTFHQHHQAFEIRKKTRWHSLLVTLWIMSTKTYIKAGLLEEANKALSEAEHLGLGDPNVWYQLGQLSLEVRTLLEQKSMVEEAAMIREMKQVAWDAFEKALILDPDHIPSQVAKATRLLEDQQVDLADGLLEHSILGLGWDSSEAWYAHAQVKKQQGQWDRVKTCLLFALELTDTQPVRDLAVLPKFIM